MTEAAPAWLARVYALSLAVHTLSAIGILGLAVWDVALRVPLADSAPGGLAFRLLLAVPVLLTAVPAAIALLSWRWSRQLGVQPSPGHMGLSVAAAALYLGVVLYIVGASLP